MKKYFLLIVLLSGLTAINVKAQTAPVSLQVTDVAYDYAILSATANAGGDNIFIAITDVPKRNNLNQILAGGTFGTPSGTYQIGDQITDGGTVVYIGGTSNNIEISALTDNVVYHLQAWSLNGSGNYSSTFLEKSFMTWGKVPYVSDYTVVGLGNIPLDWTQTGNYEFFKQNCLWGTGSWLQSNDMQGSPVNPAIVNLTTQWILLSDEKNRIEFRYYMAVPTFGTFYLPLNDWDDGSFLAIQLSTDDVNYTTVYTLNGENAPELEYPRSEANMATLQTPAFSTFSGERVKVRFLWNFTQRNYAHFEDIYISEVAACDRTSNLTVNPSSLYDGNAEISWNSYDPEANLWEVRYRVLDDEPTGEWTAPVETTSETYLFTGLPTVTDIEAQVRVKCSISSFSVWESLTFKTGYELPYTETFSGDDLPYGWKKESGLIGEDNTTFCYGYYCFYNWTVLDNKLLIESENRNFDDWAMFPLLNLGDGSYDYNLDFDFNISNESGEPINENADSYFAVVISEDGGITWNNQGILLNLPITNENLNDFENHYSVSLEGKTGVVKLAFYVESLWSVPFSISIDNVSITEACSSATNVEVSDIESHSAIITWEGEDDEWLVFVRQKGETDEDFEIYTEKIIELQDLESATTYEVGITRLCGENNYAKLIIVEFTTLATEPCIEVTDINTVPSYYSILFEWDGTGIAYNIRLRVEGDSEWVQRRVDDATSIEFTGLSENTTYEYGIQTICSNAAGDVSDWTETATVKTLVITCFPPSEIIIDPIYHNSAVVYWEGDADDYELSYRIENGEWDYIDVIGSHSCDLVNLTRQTRYQVRIRSICSDDDISFWSPSIPFTTPDIAPCAYPVNLTVEGITDVSAELSWKEGNEQNLSWEIRYRETAITLWNYINDLFEKSYLLEGLSPNTAYLWTVRAYCSEERVSAWGSQSEFITTESGISYSNRLNMTVYSSGKVITIINPENKYIESVQLFDINGKLIGDYSIMGTDNVLLPVTINDLVTIIKIIGQTEIESYKILNK